MGILDIWIDFWGQSKMAFFGLLNALLGERQSIAQKGVRAIDTQNLQLENGSNATKTSVRAPGLSTDEREHPFVWYFGAGWTFGVSGFRGSVAGRGVCNSSIHNLDAWIFIQPPS